MECLTMMNIPYLLSLDCIVLTIGAYKMSLVELMATLTNLCAVLLSTKEKISSWYVGIVAVILSFLLFYQFQLYADSTLQIFFLITNCIGWYQWSNPQHGLENQVNQLKVTKINSSIGYITIVAIFFGTFMMGRFFLHSHEYLPNLFPKPADYPFADSFIMVTSIAAQLLLMRKHLETWYLWIVVNITAVTLYMLKGILLTSFLYFIFLVLAILGLISWQKSLKSEK